VLARAFPFHFALDRENRFVQVGPVLARTFPDVEVGVPFDGVFRVTRPVFPAGHAELRARAGTLLLLEHLRSTTIMRGELAAVDEVLIFLGSPWVTDVAVLRSLGLKLSDFPNHDSVGDLLLVLQTQATALKDTHELAATLTRQRQELREANRKLAEQFEALQRAEVFHRTVLETAADAILSFDASGAIESANRATERLFGWSAEELVGRSYEVLMPSADLVPASAPRRDPRRSASRILGRAREVVGVRKDGSQVPLHVSVGEAFAGGERRYTGFLRDISELKQKEHELRERALQLEETRDALEANAERLGATIAELREARVRAEAATSAKSAFLASMSHEIRTPLNGVIGMTRVLLDTALSPDQREVATTIRSSGEVLLSLIDDILDFSKIESGNVELERAPFEPRRAIEDVLDLVAPGAAAKRVALCYRMLEDPGWVEGDITRFRQVVANLLSNAVKFTARGHIVVDVDRDERGRLRVAVTDTGVGLPAGAQGDKLFEPFQQLDSSTHRRFGGSGLGLAICRRLSVQMGGEIGFRSRLGEGSTFWFTVASPSVPAPDGVEAERPRPLRGKRVCVHHPSATVADALARLARELGAEAEACESTDAVLERLSRHPPVDAVISTSLLRTTALPVVQIRRLGPTAAGPARAVTEPVKRDALAEALSLALGLGGERPRTERKSTDQLALQRPLRILLAEDNLVNQQVALRLLSRWGYDADVVEDGEAAVSAARDGRYDFILMDVEMPGMDGLEATRRIRALAIPKQPLVVAMTAFATREHEAACHAAGMDGYLTKPVDVDALRALLGEATRIEAVGDPLDRARLETVGALGPRFLGEMIGLFDTSLAERLPLLHAAVSAGELSRVAAIAHELRGSSATVGARVLAELLDEVESAARAGRAEAVREAALTLDKACEHTRAAFRALGASA
jgi:PAS domain S-box-containing protein